MAGNPHLRKPITAAPILRLTNKIAIYVGIRCFLVLRAKSYGNFELRQLRNRKRESKENGIMEKESQNNFLENNELTFSETCSRRT